ncbi:hypothetical protein AAY473_018014 [Plecturocebus cupreus]
MGFHHVRQDGLNFLICPPRLPQMLGLQIINFKQLKMGQKGINLNFNQNCFRILWVEGAGGQSLAVLSRLKRSGVISAHRNLHLPGSRDSPSSAS